MIPHPAMTSVCLAACLPARASSQPSIVPPVLSPSSTVNLSQLDDGLQRQSIARKTRDLKLGTSQLAV
jgi:hypothetical protein